MPLYYLILKAGRHSYPDSDGQEFADDAAVRAHAQAVARELMRNRESKTAHWRIQICDDYLQPRFQILFADVDNTLERFDDDFRGSVKHVARTAAAMNDSLREIDAAMTSLRQMINQIDSIISSRPQA
jgi:methyl-accepting chemotaxis protein